MQTESWKVIKGFEGLYQVSNLGQVKSLDRISLCDGGNYQRFVKGRILKQSLNTQGYPILGLYKNRHLTDVRVHRLVATAFIPNPNNLPEVNHIDHDKTNNCVSNLEWCTRQYNVAYSDDKLNNRFRRKSGFSRAKKIEQYDLEGNLLATYIGATSVEKLLKIPTQVMRNRCIRQSKAVDGYYWRYADETKKEVPNALL